MLAFTDRIFAKRRPFQTGVHVKSLQNNLSAEETAFSHPAIRVETDWVRLAVSLPNEYEHDLIKLLELNQTVPGGAKFCLCPSGKPALLLDIIVHSQHQNVEKIIQEGGVILQQALDFLCKTAPLNPLPQSKPEADYTALKAICSETGWPVLERSPGTLLVELEGTPSFSQAEITLHHHGLVVSVLLGEWDEQLPDICTQAITHLLLRACQLFRMVRSASEVKVNTHRALLLVSLEAADLETDLPMALSALSVSAARMKHELLALKQVDIASTYLAMTSGKLKETIQGDNLK